MTAQFSLVRGGPMHWLQGRLGLLAADQLPGLRAALAFAAIAWLPPAVFSLFDPQSLTIQYGTSFLANFGGYARFLIATFMLVIIDRGADARLNRLLAGFTGSGIVRTEDLPRFTRVLDVADRRTSSWRAEAVMLVVACVAAAAAASTVSGRGVDQWMMATGGGFSPAGWWGLLVSTPLYFFLLLRWLWRFTVWTVLLRNLARLPLDLVPTHPDRVGGLGFLTLFPMIFVPFVFAISLVTASAVLHEVIFGSVTFEALRAIALVWVALIGLIFIGPLTLFSAKLRMLRETAVIDHSELVSRYNRAALRELRASDQGNGKLSTDTISGMSDIAPGMTTIQSIKLVPVESWAVMPLLASALLPYVAVAGFMVPLGDLVKRLIGALL